MTLQPSGDSKSGVVQGGSVCNMVAPRGARVMSARVSIAICCSVSGGDRVREVPGFLP